MNLIPYDEKAYHLLHQGAIALAQVESTGIRIDVEYLDGAIRRTERRLERLRKSLTESEVYRIWKKKYGSRARLNSGEQLGKVLFEEMGFPCPSRTVTGRYKTDAKTLRTVDHPFVKRYLSYRALQKVLETNLKGLRREVQGEVLHPFFNLHLARTYRSSSEAINFQNIPAWSPKYARLVRRAFIPRPGNHLVEVDYTGLEVRIAATYHKDPNLIRYICDPELDMHRDMAMACYMLSREELGSTKTKPGKQVRYAGKNAFVFPQFYGDWWGDCAEYLWRAIDEMNLTTTQGIPLRQHLASKGIHSLGSRKGYSPPPGTFMAHIKEVERVFWEEKFPTYARWKERWYEGYQSRGWIKMHTGFICSGYMKRNEVINYPVQGAAFHCLLWSLIRLVLRNLRKYRCKAHVVGQIHDSIVADIPTRELKTFCSIAKEVMTKEVVQHWPWIIVPLEVEFEATPRDTAWSEKERI